jgi:acetyltransferase-like isoleucine patch superfamily enzyme
MILRKLLVRLYDLSGGVASRWRNIYYRCLGVRMQGYVWLQAVEIPRNFHNIKLDRCSLDRGVVVLCSGNSSDILVSIGQGTYINRRAFLDATTSLIIGRKVAIGPNCYITDHDHGSDPDKPPLDQEMVGKPTHIGDFVWIGANVVILKGVSIGERTIIGAGSVVTKSLPANVIAAGVPARVLRNRAKNEFAHGGVSEHNA